MSVKLPTEHCLEFLSLKGDSRGSSESTLVKKPHCWKSHVAAHFVHILNPVLKILDPFYFRNRKCRKRDLVTEE